MGGLLQKSKDRLKKNHVASSCWPLNDSSACVCLCVLGSILQMVVFIQAELFNQRTEGAACKL